MPSALDPQDIFGTDDQQMLLRRGMALYALVAGDPRYTYYGRTVGLATLDGDDVDPLLALARLQGNSNVSSVPEAAADALQDAVTERGFAPVRYNKWEAGPAAIETARKTLAARDVPEGVSVAVVDADTTPERMGRFADLALAAGVLPPCGAVLRAAIQPAVCVLALDRDDRVVACAAAAAFADRDHATLGGQAWWGMLATDPAWRGHGLAAILGARAIVGLADGFGFHRFMTGVEPGNIASETVTARMGFAREGRVIIGVADPSVLRSGRMTK